MINILRSSHRMLVSGATLICGNLGPANYGFIAASTLIGIIAYFYGSMDGLLFVYIYNYMLIYMIVCIILLYNIIFKITLPILFKIMKQFLKTSALFLALSSGIYLCYIISAIYHQKILKQPYTHKNTGLQKYCSQSLLFTIFPQLMATIIGQVLMLVQKQKSKLPWQRCVVISSIININMFTYNQAVVYASFPAVVMAKSCSLLSVIIVGVFFTRVRDSSLRLTREKLAIGIIATVGIVLFNFFKKQEKSLVDHPITLFSLGNLYLIISLIGDGFLPDFQAQLKSDFQPSTLDMYCKINRFTFLISLTLAILSNRAQIILDFLLYYQDFALDVAKLSILNAIGQLFIYRMVKQFRQHIPAFVIAFRKCLTVIVNILWFHHSVNVQQFFGLSFVFIAVFWEVYGNYKESLQKKEGEYRQIGVGDPVKGAQDSGQLSGQLDQEIKNNQEVK